MKHQLNRRDTDIGSLGQEPRPWVGRSKSRLLSIGRPGALNKANANPEFCRIFLSAHGRGRDRLPGSKGPFARSLLCRKTER